MASQGSANGSLTVQPQPALLRSGEGAEQLIEVLIDHQGSPGTAEIAVEGKGPLVAELAPGLNVLQIGVHPVRMPTVTTLDIVLPDGTRRREKVPLEPVRYREFWLLPHSHNDIGYSDLQADVEKKQWKNLRDAMQLVRETSGFPDEARFKWNSETLWAVDSFLDVCTEEEKAELIRAVRQGDIALNGLYSHQLTGICRPEELLRLTDAARRLSRLFGVEIRDAMITDVPGLPWATVPVLALAGIRYLSSGPNFMPQVPVQGERVGHFNLTWKDKPAYLVSPSGTERILFWTTGKGYSFFHDWINGRAGEGTARHLFDYLRELELQRYPYDMVQLRYTIVADNGPVDPELPRFVKRWNERYASPRLILATAARMFGTFEERWGKTLPSYAGDITPYWEDGVLSSLYEVGLTRRSSERLVQAEALACMARKKDVDRQGFASAWRNVTLFDEHTWGAHNSVSEPESSFASEQWRVKRQFALEADRESRALMEQLLTTDEASGDAVDVLNTSSWNRTDLVVLTTGQSRGRDRVVDGAGEAVPSQRLSSGELAFLAAGVPSLGGKRYFIRPGRPEVRVDLSVDEGGMRNAHLSLALDPDTGALRSLRTVSGQEFVEASEGAGLHQYYYVPGNDPAVALKNRVEKLEIVEAGPLVGLLRVRSQAPGCRALLQEIRLVSGSNRVDLVTLLDKERVREKESVHVGFPFRVPEGTFRLDGGWCVVRPLEDQLAGSCMDYFPAGRWADLSNSEQGVTWTTIESPLVELGRMTSEVPDERGYRVWSREIAQNGHLYAYAMNNYWNTNYAAYQQGEATLTFSVEPHGPFSAVAAYRRGVERSQPLLVRRVSGEGPVPAPLFEILGASDKATSVVATSVMLSSDGDAVMVRLYNAGEKEERCRIAWGSLCPRSVFLSSLSESSDGPAGEVLSFPPYGILTLRCER